MAKKRISELAKKFGMNSKEMINIINENNIAEVTSHANSLDEDKVKKVEELIKNRGSSQNDENKLHKDKNKVKDTTQKENSTKDNMKDKPQSENNQNTVVTTENKSNKDKNTKQVKKQGNDRFVSTFNAENSASKNKDNKKKKLDPKEKQKRERQLEAIERLKKIEEQKKKREAESEQLKLAQEKLKQEREKNLDKAPQEKKVGSSDSILNKETVKLTIIKKAETEPKNNSKEPKKEFKKDRNDKSEREYKRSDRQQDKGSDKKKFKDNKDFRDRQDRGNKNKAEENKGPRFVSTGKLVRNNESRDNNRFNNKDNKDNRDNNRNGVSRRNQGGRMPFPNKDEDQDVRPVSRSPRKDSPKKTIEIVDNRRKDKNRENKEAKERYKNKDKDGKFREIQSLERTTKRTHKQAVKQKQNAVEQNKEEVSLIQIPETITVKDLADKMKIQSSVIIKEMFMKGQVYTVNNELTFEQAEEIALAHDILCELEEKIDVIEELLKEDDDKEDTLVSRPPVVCVMGHVDHGKTSLLDAIRKTNVIANESGGITQHIGAYTVEAHGHKITFLDTPGHEAFTTMRMRGANSTDIAILVVAADDGVMPQTIEAISHAKAAGINIIVAINKIDKPSANVDRVMQELSEHGIISEDWGGDNIFVQVSAKQGTGLQDLIDTIILVSEVEELKANPNRKARGLVLEAKLDKGRGPVANILVQKGTLHVGDFISAGAASGKVRAMIDDKGRKVKEAGPSTPVEILGLNDVPNAGEILIAHDSDKDAKSFASTFISEGREKLIDETKKRMTLDDLFSQIKAGNLKELSLVVKADVQGSAEAIKQSLEKLSNDEVVVKIIHSGVGAINESDVVLAGASNAIIIGFNVRPDAQARSVADQEGVDIRLYSVIYKAIEDVEAAIAGMLDPVYEEKIIGHAEIRQIFKASGIGNIAGSYVLDGYVERGCKVRITREEELVFEGDLASLKRFKDDVKEVKAGYECGLVFNDFNDIRELDKVEAYKIVEVPR